MKRLPLLSPSTIALAVSLSLLALACGPTTEQQATLIAASVNATLTAQGPHVAPTLSGPSRVQPNTPQNTLEAVQTAGPAPNLSQQGYAEATKVANWKRTKYDPLDKNLFGWCEDSRPNIGSDGSSSQFFFNRGAYEVIYKSGDKGAGSWCAPYGTYYDFNASIKALLVDADPSADYGMVFRLYHQSYSSMMDFVLSPDGKYAVAAYDTHGNSTGLQDWTPSTGLLPNGQWNKLTVDAEGSVFTFFINDVFQTQLTYTSGPTASGGIGVLVDVGNPRRSIDVRFSDFEIREP
jgi:hypothetical protein